jgi:CheY-like chemotaxis protein
MAAKEVIEGRQRVVALLSTDETLARAVGSVVEAPWRLEHRYDIGGLIDFLRLPDVRLVVVDDEAVTEGDRGWLVAQIRRHLEGATLLYVAASHSAENERRARSHGAHYYTSKPIETDDIAGVLKAFMELADRSYTA